ncbi:MAG: PAS domain S-box protein [Candidatus Delongbacteria bacterium]|nr:PAS domain S-box protein [Candidatus Delongbacteria bacterium]
MDCMRPLDDGLVDPMMFFYEQILDGIPDPALLLDSSGQVCRVNPMAREQTGKGSESRFGIDRNLFAVQPESGMQSLESMILALIPDGCPARFTYIHPALPPSLNRYQIIVQPLRNQTGNPIYWLLICRIEPQPDLFQSVYQPIREAWDLSHDMSFIIDYETLICIEVNQTACQKLGYDRREILGRPIHPLRMKFSMEDGRHEFDRLKESDHEELTLHTFMYRQDGSLMSVEIVERIFEIEGRLLVLMMAGDITHFLYLEDELKQARQVAESAGIAKSRFLATISHEIRTPMNGVIGMADVLMDTELSSEQQYFVEVIQNSGQALLSIINDILDYSNIESNKLELKKSEIDIRTLIEGVAESYAIKAFERGVEFHCLVDSEVPGRLWGDPLRLKQVVVNLVNNAVKFTHQGEVMLSLNQEWRDGNQVGLYFSISDTGIGIAAEKQNLLFTPFAQADSASTRKYSGTGLGLAITKRLIEMMGGRIGYETEETKGSVFWFTLPFELASTDGSGESPTEQAETRPWSQWRYLLVDSHPVSRQTIINLFAYWRIQIDTCDGPESAEARLIQAQTENHPYRVMMLNLNDSESIDRLTRYRQNQAGSELMIMLICSQLDLKNGRAASIHGIDGVITRPFTRFKLFSLLDRSFQPMDLDQVTTAERWPSHDHKRILLMDDNLTLLDFIVLVIKNFNYEFSIAENRHQALGLLTSEFYDLIIMNAYRPELQFTDIISVIRDSQSGVLNHSIPIIGICTSWSEKMTLSKDGFGFDDCLIKPFSAFSLGDMLRKWLSPERRIPASE